MVTIFARAVSFAGNSDVYATGYKTTSSILPGQYPYFDGEDTSDEDEDEDDDQPPQAIPLGQKRRAAILAVRFVCRLQASFIIAFCILPDSAPHEQRSVVWPVSRTWTSIKEQAVRCARLSALQVQTSSIQSDPLLWR